MQFGARRLSTSLLWHMACDNDSQTFPYLSLEHHYIGATLIMNAYL
jgi:hypothetical protein